MDNKIKIFNTGPIIFGQVLDAFVSSASMTAAIALFPDQTKALKDWVSKNFNVTQKNSNYLVTRSLASLGNLANAATQMIGAEMAEQGGAKKSIVNAVFGKAISTGLGLVFGFAADSHVTIPLGNVITNVLNRANPKLNPETAKELGYGYASEAVNSAFSLASTLLGNSSLMNIFKFPNSSPAI